MAQGQELSSRSSFTGVDTRSGWEDPFLSSIKEGSHQAKVVPKEHVAGLPPRPATPSMVEKAAAVMRALAFATATGTSDDDDVLQEEWKRTCATLIHDMGSAPMQKLRAHLPAFGARVEATLSFVCGVLMSIDLDTASLHAASNQLSKLINSVETGMLPGAYYDEIFRADASKLAAICEEKHGTASRRRAAVRDAWAALCAPQCSASELDSIAAQADRAGLVHEALGVRNMARMARQAGVREAALQARERANTQLRDDLERASAKLKDAEGEILTLSNARADAEQATAKAREVAASAAEGKKHVEEELRAAAAAGREEEEAHRATKRELELMTIARGELEVCACALRGEGPVHSAPCLRCPSPQ